MGSGKVFFGICKHDEVVGKIGKGVGKIKRDTGNLKRAGLQATIAQIRNTEGAVEEVASRAVARAGEMVRTAVDHVESAFELEEVCEPTSTKVNIRKLTKGRGPGEIDQIRCPNDIANRCAGCVIEAAERPGFDHNRLGGVLAIAKGDLCPVTFGDVVR